MLQVQASFKGAEDDPTYDAQMRTYSGSNRETLHRAVSVARIGRTGPHFEPGPPKRPAHQDAESS